MGSAIGPGELGWFDRFLDLKPETGTLRRMRPQAFPGTAVHRPWAVLGLVMIWFPVSLLSCLR